MVQRNETAFDITWAGYCPKCRKVCRVFRSGKANVCIHFKVQAEPISPLVQRLRSTRRYNLNRKVG